MVETNCRAFSNLLDRGANAGWSEMRIGKAGSSATHLRWTISSFLSLRLISLLLTSIRCFFPSLSCPPFRAFTQKISVLLTAQLALFKICYLKGALPSGCSVRRSQPIGRGMWLLVSNISVYLAIRGVRRKNAKRRLPRHAWKISAREIVAEEFSISTIATQPTQRESRNHASASRLKVTCAHPKLTPYS